MTVFPRSELDAATNSTHPDPQALSMRPTRMTLHGTGTLRIREIGSHKAPPIFRSLNHGGRNSSTTKDWLSSHGGPVS